jgi:hypothetical protein
MALSGLGGLRADAGGMPGGGGCGAGSWRAGQEGGIPPSTTMIIVSTKARSSSGSLPSARGGDWYAQRLRDTCYEKLSAWLEGTGRGLPVFWGYGLR